MPIHDLQYTAGWYMLFIILLCVCFNLTMIIFYGSKYVWLLLIKYIKRIRHCLIISHRPINPQVHLKVKTQKLIYKNCNLKSVPTHLQKVMKNGKNVRPQSLTDIQEVSNESNRSSNRLQTDERYSQAAPARQNQQHPPSFA